MTAQHAGTAAHYTPLGLIESTAPAAALLATLHSSRPQWPIRLSEIESPGVPRYRVEVDADAALATVSRIDAWLQLKSALMARFPADKPDAVTAIDP